MANDAKKVSELAVTTTLSANDRVVILSSPSSAANTKTITAANFANSLVSSGIIPTATTTQLGVVKVDGTTITISNGVISGASVYNQQLNTTNNVTFASLTTANISSQNNVTIRTGNNSYAWTFQANGELKAPGNIIPTANNVYTLGNSSVRWQALWIGGNSVVFADQNPSYPDQTLTVGNGVFYIAETANTAAISNAGFRVGNFLLQNNFITLTDSNAVFYIGSTLATGNLVINRPVVMNNPSTNAQIFGVTREGRVQINPPTIPSNDIGALSVVGSADGSYKPVRNPGGMLHITGNANTTTRVTLDNFGSGNTTVQLIGRSGRGTSNTATASQANDVLFRIAGAGYINDTTQFATVGALVPTTIEFVALDNFTDGAQGSTTKFYNAPSGNSVKTLSMSVTANGITLPSNAGIRFSDNTYQNTAFSNTSAVTKINVGTGLTQSGNVGIVGIDSTAVLTVSGTANQVIVANVGQNVTLSLPQSIGTTSNVQFKTITVQNLVVTGNSTIANSASISNAVIQLAYNSTNSAQIDTGGFTLGNTASAYYVSFLYNLSNNAWTTGNTNLITQNITANAVSASNGNFTAQLHAGAAYAGYDFPNATVQADCNINSYNQIVEKNHNSGTQASADFVAVNDIGTDSNNYIDLGINSSNYANNDYSIVGPNDGYLYINGGDLAIGTQTTNKQLKFFVGGTTANNKIASANTSGWFLDNLTVTNTIIGTANNVAFVGSIAAANVVSNAQLSANLANYQTTAGLSANVSLLTANAAGYLGNSSGTLANIASWISGNAATAYSNAVSSFSGTYQTTAGLAANVATLTSNNASFVGSIPAANVVSNGQLQSNLASYQTLVGLAANVIVLTSNSANFIGSIPSSNVVTSAQLSGNLAGYVSSTQLSGNLANYQTSAGLSANVVLLAANSASYIGTLPAANVVSNAQLIANLANYVTGANFTANLVNYQTTAGLSANVVTLSSNSTTYLGNSSGTLANIASWVSGNAATAYSNAVANAAALYQTTAGLSANVVTLTANAATYHGNSSGTLANIVSWITGNSATAYSNAVANAAALYQTTAGLSANVLTLSSNNASYLGGVAANVYVRSSGSYTWTNTHTFSNVITFTSEINVHNMLANGVYGANGQVLVANSVDGMYWADLKTHKAKKVKHKDGSYDPEIDATVLQDTMTFVDGDGIVMVSNTTNQTIQINARQSIRDAGANNSLVIDFATDEIVLVQPNNTSTISMNNYSIGKKIQVWVKPTTTKAITLSGVTAAQATGACTAPVPVSGQMIKMEFFSTTTANTGVYVDVNR